MSHKLVVMSDFLEDDGTNRFVLAGSLASSDRARVLATRLREQHSFTLQSVSLCLGCLESSDFAPLSAERKEAFWQQIGLVAIGIIVWQWPLPRRTRNAKHD